MWYFGGEYQQSFVASRVGHNKMGDVERLSYCVLGMNFQRSSFEKTCVCNVCQFSKSHKTPVSNNSQRLKSEKKPELVFSDVFAPMPTTFLGCLFFAISIDDSFSRFGAVYFMKAKSECLQKFKVICAQVGLQRYSVHIMVQSTLVKHLLIFASKRG